MNRYLHIYVYIYIYKGLNSCDELFANRPFSLFSTLLPTHVYRVWLMRSLAVTILVSLQRCQDGIRGGYQFRFLSLTTAGRIAGNHGQLSRSFFVGMQCTCFKCQSELQKVGNIGNSTFISWPTGTDDC